MFGLFAPRPPLEVFGKAWVERGLNRLAARLGPARLGLAGGPPVEQLSPSEALAGLGPTDEAAAALLARFAGHLGLNAEGVRVEWRGGEHDPDPAAAPNPGDRLPGLWRRAEDGAPVLALNRALAEDPANLAKVVARELCREPLLTGAGGEPPASVAAAEPDAAASGFDADLASVALGLGLFAANGRVREQTAPDPVGIGRQADADGYLTAAELGYALASLWHARNPDGPAGDPPWLGELRGDAAAAAAGGLKYLRKTGDTLFTAQSAAQGSIPPTEAAIREELRRRRPARRLAAAWDAAQLPDRESGTPAAETATLDCLSDVSRDREPAVRAAACAALGALCPAPAADRERWERCLLALIAATDDPLAAVRAAGLRGLAALPELPADGAGREELDRAVREGLPSRTPAVRSAAAAVLARLPGPPPDAAGGEGGSPFAPTALKALVGALVRCDDREAAEHAALLHALHPDPAALAEQEVPDPEMRARVRDALGVEPLDALGPAGD